MIKNNIYFNNKLVEIQDNQDYYNFMNIFFKKKSNLSLVILSLEKLSNKNETISKEEVLNIIDSDYSYIDYISKNFSDTELYKFIYNNEVHFNSELGNYLLYELLFNRSSDTQYILKVLDLILVNENIINKVIDYNNKDILNKVLNLTYRNNKTISSEDLSVYIIRSITKKKKDSLELLFQKYKSNLSDTGKKDIISYVLIYENIKILDFIIKQDISLLNFIDQDIDINSISENKLLYLIEQGLDFNKLKSQSISEYKKDKILIKINKMIQTSNTKTKYSLLKQKKYIDNLNIVEFSVI